MLLRNEGPGGFVNGDIGVVVGYETLATYYEQLDPESNAFRELTTQLMEQLRGCDPVEVCAARYISSARCTECELRPPSRLLYTIALTVTPTVTPTVHHRAHRRVYRYARRPAHRTTSRLPFRLPYTTRLPLPLTPWRCAG